jgi:hypothetical protein
MITALLVVIVAVGTFSTTTTNIQSAEAWSDPDTDQEVNQKLQWQYLKMETITSMLYGGQTGQVIGK